MMLEVKVVEAKTVEKTVEQKNVLTIPIELKPLMIYQTNTGESDTSLSLTYLEHNKLTYKKALDKVLTDDDELLKRLAD